MAAYEPPPPTVTRGVLAKYAELVSSASEGAVTRAAPSRTPVSALRDALHTGFRCLAARNPARAR